MQQHGIILQIFSGCHVGAEILIPKGKYLIGSDDSCDFIFLDKNISPHHFTLEITENLTQENISYTVKINPIEGKLSLANEEISEEYIWETKQLLSAQGIFLAWFASNDENRTEELIQNISQNLYRPQNSNTEKNQITENQVEHNQIDKNKINEQTQNNSETDNKIDSNSPQNTKEDTSQQIISNQKENQNSQNAIDKKKKNYISMSIAVIALLALVFTFTPIENSEFKDIATMQQYLSDNGFSKVQCIVTDKGIIWQGMVNNDTERAKLHTMAQKMHFPVYLDIMVSDDAAKTFKNIFALKNLYPTVRADEQGIFLGCYIKDELYYQIILQTLKNMLPHYEEIKSKLNIKTIFAHELEALLKDKNTTYKIKQLTPLFEEGRILFARSYNQKERTQINALMAEIQKELTFSIPYVFFTPTLTTEKTPKDTGRIQKKYPANISSTQKGPAQQNDFSVTSVNMGTIPFITLSNNEKVFIGGILPNGGILEHISLHELTINHNGSITIYPLRGN